MHKSYDYFNEMVPLFWLTVSRKIMVSSRKTQFHESTNKRNTRFFFLDCMKYTVRRKIEKKTVNP